MYSLTSLGHLFYYATSLHCPLLPFLNWPALWLTYNLLSASLVCSLVHWFALWFTGLLAGSLVHSLYCYLPQPSCLSLSTALLSTLGSLFFPGSLADSPAGSPAGPLAGLLVGSLVVLLAGWHVIDSS